MQSRPRYKFFLRQCIRQMASWNAELHLIVALCGSMNALATFGDNVMGVKVRIARWCWSSTDAKRRLWHNRVLRLWPSICRNIGCYFTQGFVNQRFGIVFASHVRDSLQRTEISGAVVSGGRWCFIRRGSQSWEKGKMPTAWRSGRYFCRYLIFLSFILSASILSVGCTRLSSACVGQLLCFRNPQLQF